MNHRPIASTFARPSIRRAALTFLAFVTVAGYAPSRAYGGDPAEEPVTDPFPGEWSVHVVPDADAVADGQSTFNEAILFHEGQFSAAVFAMFGFSPAAYEVTLVEGRPVFKVTLASEDRGTLVWSGSETRTGFSGELVWTHADGNAHNYTVRGERE